MKYKFLEHTADIKIKLFGSSLSNVFENAALAVSEFLSRGEKIKNQKVKKIKIKGEDYESLMYGFLDELVYLLDAKYFVVAKAKVKIDKKLFVLEGKLFGDNASNYENLDHYKAATYTEMYIKQKPDKSWEAQVVLDV